MRLASTTIQENSSVSRGRELHQQTASYQLERWLRETKEEPWHTSKKSQAPLSDQRVRKLLDQGYSRTSTDIHGCPSVSPSDDSLRVLSKEVSKALSG